MKVTCFANCLGSIGAPIDEEDLVSMNSNGLRREYVQVRTSIGDHEAFLDFHELVALLLSEEQRNGGSAIGSSQEFAFYSN